MIETTDHNQIREWAENNGGKPQIFDNPGAGADRVGLRIDFPGNADDDFARGPNAPRDVSWDSWFRAFDTLGLAFEYEDDPESRDIEDKSQLYRFGRRGPPA